MRKLMWAISLRSRTQSKFIRFRATGKEAVEKAKGVKAKYAGRKDVIVELISLGKAFAPPEEFKIPRGKLWCPYCRVVRVFVSDGDVEKCPVCTISIRDFYVKTYNHLWPRGKR